MNSKYTIIDLFSGIGGFGYGFLMEETGCFAEILANDLWMPCVKTFMKNHPGVPVITDDIRTLDEKKMRRFKADKSDVVIGGPPCQGFSMCGTRDVEDKRNTLFQEYAKIVKYVKPKIFVMENVKGLLSMKTPSGEPVIEAIKNTFSKQYDVNWSVLNAAAYGVPQKRERVIIVGVLKNTSSLFEFPAPTHFTDMDSTQLGIGSVGLAGPVTVRDALSDLPEDSSPNGEKRYKGPKTEYQNIMRRGQNCIFNHEIPVHNAEVVRRMSVVPPGGNWQDIPLEIRAGGTHSNAYKRLDPEKPSVTIKHAFKSMIIHPYQNRCLTIRETARIQSFPDDFIFEDCRSTQYQQLANAVPPLLAKAIAGSVKEYLNKLGKEPKKRTDLRNK